MGLHRRNGMEITLELLVLAAVASPLVRLTLSRPFRQRLAAHPGLVRSGLAAVAAGIALLGLVVWEVPMLLRAIAVLSVGGGIYALWRARPGYGRRRRLPPGSLWPISLMPLLDDRYYLNQALRHGPVFKTSRFH